MTRAHHCVIAALEPSAVASRSALAVLASMAVVACGQSYTPDGGGSGGSRARPLAALYDSIVTVPGLAFPQYGASGLMVDLTLQIDPNGPDSSGLFEATVTVNEVQVAGVRRPFDPSTPLPAMGRLAGADWTLDPFGPVEVGDTSTGQTAVMLSLAGTLASDGRRIDGMALDTASGQMGSFHAVKQRRYLVAGTDFGVTGTASLVRVRFDTVFEVDRDVEAISGDPVARATGGGAYVVNRFFFDNIQELDPAAGFATSLQFSTGNGSNPHDVLAVDPGRLYITRYEPPYNDILIADRRTGDPLGFVELSALATNASGTPRADSLVLVDGLVFASLQNIDSTFTEYGPGRLAAIDPPSGAVVRGLTLVGLNPFGPPAVHPITGELYYAMAGVFGGSLPRDLSGGIEVIDTATLTTRGLLVDDDLLGGNVSSVALAQAAGRVVGFCVVATDGGENIVRAFDPDTGAVTPGTILRSASFLTEVVSDGDGYILVPVHDIADPRLVVIDAATGSLVSSQRLTLPPFSVAVLTRPLTR